MYRLVLRMKILLGSNPGLFLDLRIAYLVEDTVTYILNWIIIMFFTYILRAGNPYCHRL